MKSSDASGYGSLLTSEREIHLKDLLFVVFHHWKIAAVFPVLVAGGAYLSGRNFVTQYRSHLTVQVSSPKQVFARLDDIDVDELALRTDPILSEALVLTTQTLARRVVEAPQTQLQLHLVDPRDHRGAIMGSVEVDRGAPLQGFTESYELTRRPTGWELRDATTGRVADFGTYADRAEGPGFRFRPIQLTPTQSEERTLFQILPWQMAASFVTGGISYSVREATTAVDISFTGTDPTLVPRILNQAAVELRQMGVDRALASAERRGNYIDQELARYDSLHSAKMSELQALRETEQITDLSAEETAIISSIATSEEARHELLAFISTLRAAVGEEETIGIEALNRLSAIPETANNSALAFQISSILNLYNERRELTAGTLGLSNSNPRVQALDQRILDGHRELRNAVTAALQSAQTRLETIEDRIAARRSQLATIPGKATQVAEIQLEAEILNQTLEYLLGQQQIARMQSATIGPYIQILDGASPPAPIGTSRNQKILLGFLVGVLLGIGAAFFLEYLDQTIKTSADIERILRVPVLGIIPDDPRLSTKTNRREGIRVISSLDPDDQRAEAFRSLRTNVTFVGAERALQFVAITSPSPGEGKSTTAANLAATLAMGGHRALLVDGDLRRPLLHVPFRLVQEPGLTDVLIGRSPAREAIRPNVAPNLDVLPAGPTPPNPSELLGSDAMHGLISELRRHYDYIIMDTPPTLPVTDAAVVASFADATIVVVRCAATEEQAANRSIDQLRRVHARVAGAVLNGVQQKHDRYYYSYDSYRSEPPDRRPVATASAGRIAS